MSWHLIGRICCQRLKDTKIVQTHTNIKNNSSKKQVVEHITYEESMPDVISSDDRKDSLSIPTDTGVCEHSQPEDECNMKIN